MDKTEFKTKIDEFLRFLDWMDNATYEIVHDDNYGEGEGEHWRATIHAKSHYGSRDVEVITNPDSEDELAIDLGEDNYFDLDAEWFWAFMWHEAERELEADRPRVKSIEDEIARLRDVIVDMRTEAKTLGFDNHEKRKRVAELEQALREAIKALHVFHGEPGWESYVKGSPEMKRWRALLGNEAIAECILPNGRCADCDDRLTSGCRERAR